MSSCCCSLAGTAACRTCSNNPFAETPPPVRTYTVSATDPVLITGQKTNADRIWSMSDEELANQLVSEQYVAMKTVLTLLCQKLKDEEMLEEKEAKELFCNFENEAKKKWGDMLKEKLEWLKSPAEEVDE